MLYNYAGKNYMTFRGLMNAVKKDHPRWPQMRVQAYAGSIRARQMAGKTYKKYQPKTRKKR